MQAGYFFLLLCWLPLLIAGCLDAALISKVFYHNGQCEDKLVFYLDHSAAITKRGGAGYIEYTIKGVQVSKIAQEVLRSIPKRALTYGIYFTAKDDELAIKIDFTSDAVAKIYAAKFRPISQPYGIAIKILRTGVAKSQHCLRQVAHKEIVLDFGHGGQDSGAMFGAIAEKDVVRGVGLKLAKILKKQGYVVHLTRAGDNFVSLDERTYFANLHTKAGLFISLHANYAANPKTAGLETYYMHYDLFSSVDEGASKVSRYLLNSRSALLATQIHQQLITALKDYKLVDRKVKQSVSQVLLGVEMPAVLVELGFLSNLQEAQLLNSPAYQLILAHGIANGISAYFAV